MSLLAIAQYAFDPSAQVNLSVLEGVVATAAKKGASLLLLPELCTSQYFPIREHDNVSSSALSLDSEEIARVCMVAKEHSLGVIFPFFEQSGDHFFNSALYIDALGEINGHYRKRHIPYDPHFYEKNYFEVGDLGPVVVDTPLGKVGVLICWDQWFPEAAREVTQMGAELIVYPTAIGWLANEKDALGEAQLNAWKTIQRSHAIANGVFVAAANRIGTEVSEDNPSGIEFWGNSFCVDPFGRVCSELNAQSDLMFVEINTNLISETRNDWPFLRDLRNDYGKFSETNLRSEKSEFPPK